LVRLIRYEVQLMAIEIRGRLSLRQRRVRRRLSTQDELKLHIGSGPSPAPGWVNIDGTFAADLRMDLRGRLPLRSGSVAYIFTEHFLDHMQFPEGIGKLLRECARVLKHGGVMRAVVHDGDLLLRAFVNDDREFFRRLMAPEQGAHQTPMVYVNHIFRFDGFHQFVYDYPTLERQFLKAGFSSVRASSFRGSAVPELNLDLDLPDRTLQSLYVEAVR
jgi:predicted SAM-dependent methyltransferase